MPTYGYRCPKCGHEFEKLQKITDESRARCPECDTMAERLISGGAGVVFKGSGFYETDYKRAASSPEKPAASPKSGAPKTGDGGKGGASSSDSSPTKPSGSDGSSSGGAKDS